MTFSEKYDLTEAGKVECSGEATSLETICCQGSTRFLRSSRFQITCSVGNNFPKPSVKKANTQAKDCADVAESTAFGVERTTCF